MIVVVWAALLWRPEPPPTEIRPGFNINGVSLGMTRAEVENLPFGGRRLGDTHYTPGGAIELYGAAGAGNDWNTFVLYDENDRVKVVSGVNLLDGIMPVAVNREGWLDILGPPSGRRPLLDGERTHHVYDEPLLSVTTFTTGRSSFVLGARGFPEAPGLDLLPPIPEGYSVDGIGLGFTRGEVEELLGPADSEEHDDVLSVLEFASGQQVVLAKGRGVVQVMGVRLEVGGGEWLRVGSSEALAAERFPGRDLAGIYVDPHTRVVLDTSEGIVTHIYIKVPLQFVHKTR